MRRRSVSSWLVVTAAACGGGGEGGGRGDEIGSAPFALDAPIAEAYCEVQLEGTGVIDMEDDYLAHVVQCENGAAPLEALKAQAVAARSVAYWNMGTHGSICDSQGCQVYSCNKDPLPIHLQAVRETSGEYLHYNGNLTYASYVAGDPDTSPPACIGQGESSYITYNDGKTGTDVEQTTLLFRHDPGDAEYGQNRGCMSQNGASCLADDGKSYVDILKFYYGADIVLARATGPCVLPSGEGGAGGGGSNGTTVAASVAAATTTTSSVAASSGAGGVTTGTGGGATDLEPDDEGCDCTVTAGDDRSFGGSVALGLGLIGALRIARRRKIAHRTRASS